MAFNFIDLFAGIGGIRIAFEHAGGRCVFSSEYDRFAQRTYRAFFGEMPDFAHIYLTDPPGDITKLPPELVPDHDILTAGFPCQPFSIAGVSKKNSMGVDHGFDDPTQGTLFFNVKEIILAKRPLAFLLENVKNLQSHDGGRTYRMIRDTLEKECGYRVFERVIDAQGWVPQHRERIYIVGFRSHRVSFPELDEIRPLTDRRCLDDILEDDVPEKYTLGAKTWETLLRHRAHHSSVGNGFGYGLVSPPFDGKVTRTLSARYYKDGAEILIDQGEGRRPRRLTPLECSRLMGFPERYQAYFARRGDVSQPVSDTQAYKQFGNSVVVPLVMELARAVVGGLS